MTTFDFGYGPVAAHQHRSGGGWVADTARVSDKVFVGPLARVAGGTIEGGTIWGGTIWGGTIWGGTIWGGTIEGGTIEGGTIRGGTIEGGTIRGGTILAGAAIKRTEDAIVIGPLGSRDDLLTIYSDEAGLPLVATGCFEGTPDAFLAAVEQTHGDTSHGKQYGTAVAFALGLWDARRAEATP